MSCNGCRVLRRGCSDECILRPCLDWIQTPQAQANATLFVSKFFGRSDLMSFISAVPENKRPALFQSLLFEACGRTVNPVSGAVGLVSTGNWNICQTAVETVLAGGELRSLCGGNSPARKPVFMHGSAGETRGPAAIGRMCVEKTASFVSGYSELSPPELGSSRSSSSIGNGVSEVGSKKPKLLNLFG